MTLNQRIQTFYDQSTAVWLDMWGEHMHHGYYGPDGSEQKDHLQAQIDLVTELLRWGDVQQVEHFLDAGCGVGGSSRFLAKLYGASGMGVTLSPVQVAEARRLTQQAKLDDRLTFEVKDMMTIQASEKPFDLIWSMESAEHIREKERLFQLFYDCLRPGGQFVMATWCHRELDTALTPGDQKLLDQICHLYHLPPLVAVSDLQAFARQAGFQGVETADWSAAVAPFWPAVIRSAISLPGVKGLLKSGWGTIKGAWAMRYMRQGFRNGLLKFGLVKGQKI